MQFRPGERKRVWNYKKIVGFGILFIVLIALILYGTHSYSVYSEEKRKYNEEENKERICEEFTANIIKDTFKINSSEYKIINNVCNLNNSIEIKQRLDVEIQGNNNYDSNNSNLSMENGSIVHLIDKIDNCSSEGCDHTLCIGTDKTDDFYVKLSDYVCGNRVSQDGKNINMEMEFQRRECHIYFERNSGNRTIFSAFFPRGVGVIKLERGSLEC